MSDVEFISEKKILQPDQERESHSFYIRIVMKLGLAKDERQANIVLVITSCIFLALSVIILLR